MREIFSNAAVTRLAQSLTDSELVLTVESTANFPVPVVGDEYFALTVSGACNNSVEVMRAVEICGDNCIRVDIRGWQETTPTAFSPGDLVYHSLTAYAAQNIIDRFQWYLGPFDEEPVADNDGNPLLEGHLYYNTVSKIVMVYDGEFWVPFHPLIAATVLETFTWVPLSPIAADAQLPWPDIYGQSPSDWELGNHGIELYINGTRMIQEIDDNILEGNYTIDYTLDEITTLDQIEIGDVVVAVVLLADDATVTSAYIQRTEVDSSAYGFVDLDPLMAADSDLLLPSQKAAKAYADGKVNWQNTWAAQVYQPNDMVVDGEYLAVANAVTAPTDRPAPQVTPATPPTYGHPSPSWATVANGNVVTVTSDFTLNTGGWIQTIKLAAMDVGTITQYTVEILDVTNPGAPIQLYQPQTVLNVINSEVELNIGDIYVDTAKDISVRLTYTGTTVVRDEEVAYWTGTIPAWASDVVGTIDIDGGGFTSSDDAYGIDILFQPGDDLNANWDYGPRPAAGSGGGGGGGGGSGTVHYVDTVAPQSNQGNDGDLWFVKE
jgi:hypothetical protein